MKIQFNLTDYIEVRQVGQNVQIVISAKDLKNPRSSTVHTVEITKEQFSQLVGEILVEKLKE